MSQAGSNDLGEKLTAVEKARREDKDFAQRLEQDPAAALAELKFTAAEASKFRLAATDEYDDSCSCFGSVGKGCLIPNEPGTFG